MSRQQITPEHDRGMSEGISQKTLPSNGKVVFERSRDAELFAGFVDQAARAAEDANFRMCIEKSDLLFQTLRLCHIIAIHPRDISSARCIQPPVKRRCQPYIAFVANKTNPRIRYAAHHPFTRISRSIIDDHELEVFEALPEDACKRL